MRPKSTGPAMFLAISRSRQVSYRVPRDVGRGFFQYAAFRLELGNFAAYRRFLIHVLPRGFHQIRRYDLLVTSTQEEAMGLARVLLGISGLVEEPQPGQPPDHAHAAADTRPLSRPSLAGVSPARRQRLHSQPGNTRHEPGWLSLHDGRAQGALADDPARVPPEFNKPQRILARKANAARNLPPNEFADPTNITASGAAPPTRQNQPKAYLPIDQRAGPRVPALEAFARKRPITFTSSHSSFRTRRPTAPASAARFRL